MRKQGALHGNTLLMRDTSHPSKVISDTFVCLIKKNRIKKDAVHVLIMNVIDII